MWKTQENKYTMAKAVDNYLDENQDIVSATPEFQFHHILLKSKNTEIELMNNQRHSVFVGKILSKRSERKDVINKALAVRGAIYAYAKKIKNNELIERATVVKSTLDRIRDTELLGKVKSMRDLANEHSAALEPYGITPAKLTAFIEKINLYETALGLRESSMAMRKGAIKSLKTLFKELDEILVTLDKLVDGLIEEKPDFVRNYYLARSVQNLGLRHRKEEPPLTGSEGEGSVAPENKGSVL